MKELYIINKKSYPLDCDGGTAYTTFELLNTALDIPYKSKVLIPSLINMKADHRLPLYNTTIAKIIFLIYSSRKNSNSAYDFYLIPLSLSIALMCKILTVRCKFLYSGHGSFDDFLVKKSLNKKIWIKFVVLPFIRTVQPLYVCNSQGEKSSLYSPLMKNTYDRIEVVENGFPGYSFKYDLIEENPSILNFKLMADERPFVLFIGRVVRKKRLIETVEVLASSGWFENGGRLIIVHTNSDENYFNLLVDHIDKNNLSNYVIFYSGLYGKVKWEVINKSAAIILLSSSEGMPMALAEADFIGVPVVCTEESNYNPMSKNSVVFEAGSTLDEISSMLSKKLLPIVNSKRHAERDMLVLSDTAVRSEYSFSYKWSKFLHALN